MNVHIRKYLKFIFRIVLIECIMNTRYWTGIILILIALPLLLMGLKDRESEDYNQWVVRQAKIAQSQGGSYPYTLRPIVLGSTALFVASGIFLVLGLISLYRVMRSEMYEAY